MATDTVERKLAAILAADVVGYSRLMGADEAGTHARLKKLRKDFIEPKIATYRGRIVKLTGDGALAEFASVVDAVQCAVQIQEGMAERSAAAEHERIELRIGINLGDVIFDEDDIYGDGVNVAARLEGLAPAGGICVSELVRLSTQARLDLDFEDLGEQQVKNIATPVRVWQWTATGSTNEPRVAGDGQTQALPDKPSIAVLPFDNMSADPEQAYFSDGITEDLITDLSQISGLAVAARNAVFVYKGQPVQPQQVSQDLGVRYVLEGSIRRAANRLRINAQLIDGTSGFHLWAQRYDRVLEDIFDLQDEITHEIVDALKIHLTPQERGTIARRYTENLEAYDLFLQARESHLIRRTKDGAERARIALERAIELDPGFAAAHSFLAENYRQEWAFEWRNDADVLDHALALAREAVRLDEESSHAHMVLGWIHLWRKGYDQAIAEARRSVELDPGHAEAWARLGHILGFSGRPEEGVPLLEKAIRLDPHHPFIYPFWLGHTLMALERDEEAVAAFRRSINRAPDFIAAHQHAAAALALLGRLDEARAEAAAAVRIRPNYSIQRQARLLPYKDPAVLARFVDGLRKAGLPE